VVLAAIAYGVWRYINRPVARKVETEDDL